MRRGAVHDVGWLQALHACRPAAQIALQMSVLNWLPCSEACGLPPLPQSVDCPDLHKGHLQRRGAGFAKACPESRRLPGLGRVCCLPCQKLLVPGYFSACPSR